MCVGRGEGGTGWEEGSKKRAADLHQVDWLELLEQCKVVDVCIVPKRVVL